MPAWKTTPMMWVALAWSVPVVVVLLVIGVSLGWKVALICSGAIFFILFAAFALALAEEIEKGGS